MAEFTADLMDRLFEPPNGWTFTRGVVLTHDCNWAHLTDAVAPALVGCTDGSPTVRRRAAQAVPGAQLWVLADARRTSGGPLHPWARLVPVGGRRLHAKVGILEFGSGNGRRRYRGWVTSANLTHSGTSRNLELALVDECTATDRSPRLVADLAVALEALLGSAEVTTADRRSVRSAVRSLRRGMTARPTGGLIHSLDAERPIVDGLPRAAGHADRIVIVTPAFAAASDSVPADLMAPWIGDATRVELITQAGTDGTLRFSAAVLGGLRALAGSGSVTVSTVPLDPVGQGEVQRRLHAKLVATVHGEVARVLVGSANFTAPGLSGRNREAVVAVEMSAAELEALLDHVSAEPHRGRFGVPPPPAPEPSEPVPLVRATFTVDTRFPFEPANLVGRLEVVAEEGTIRSVSYDGTPLCEWRSRPVAIREDLGWIEVEVDLDGRRFLVRVQLAIEGLDDQPDYWPPVDRPNGPDELQRLLGTLRLATRRGRRSGDGAPSSVDATTGEASDDKFVIPLEQRLVLLARYRERVAPTFRANWEARRARLESLLSPHELLIAAALFGLERPDGLPGGSSPVLDRLAAAADALAAARTGAQR